MSRSAGVSFCHAPGCERVVDLYRENICGEMEVDQGRPERACGGVFCFAHLAVGNADGPYPVALCVDCAPSASKVFTGVYPVGVCPVGRTGV